MDFTHLTKVVNEQIEYVQTVLSSGNTYLQFLLVALCYAAAFAFVTILNRRRSSSEFSQGAELDQQSITVQLRSKLTEFTRKILFLVLSAALIKISILLIESFEPNAWLMRAALIITCLIILNRVISQTVKSAFAANLLKWIATPLLCLHMIGGLEQTIAALESVSFNTGNVSISLYGVMRLILFGLVIFWMGRASSQAGQKAIRKQKNIDTRTKEVSAKLFEISVFLISAYLLTQVMGVNLTTLAVFSGAIGVGIGIGLQSIASNFISGLIILLDRSLSLGDYIEFDDGKLGVVREMNLRSTTLETFDGKDIVVPNERFITQTFVNWTHKDTKQRYRVDFTVAYDSDLHKLVELIKNAVSAHPQVFSGEDVPIEEQPDCEIDSFGDSGVSMFVEFWMEGIDDGKNRVGGDLLLTIFDTLRDNGFTIPFPQREVRVLDSEMKIKKVKA